MKVQWTRNFDGSLNTNVKCTTLSSTGTTNIYASRINTYAGAVCTKANYYDFTVQNNKLNWKVYVGNDGTHPCVIIGPGDGSYWQSCCVPWVYYHNAANSGPLTITPITNLSGINRLSQLA